MKVKVLFFARSREVAGVSETEVDLPPGAAVPLMFLSHPRQRQC
jgi:molybdopterin converting factor small subunit